MVSLKNKILAAGILAMSTVAGSALAQQPAAGGADDVKVTIGLKLWYASWETWGYNAPCVTCTVQSTTAGNRMAAIPNIAINYRDFFASAGYFAKRNYGFPNNLDVKRDEFDFNLGYWLLRGDAGGRLGITAGYKEVNQWFPGLKDTKKAVTIGFTGSAPIAAGWFLYGNGAFGPAREKFPGENNKGHYASGEVGVAYPVAPNTTLTLGYKMQITDFDVKFSNDRGRDTTNGFIVGANYTF